VGVAVAVAVSLLSIVAVFQIALALGAPFGAAAWGGQHDGVLPRRLRIASAVAGLVVYPLIIVAILDEGSLDGELLPWNPEPVMWTFAALFGMGTLANLASRSRIERLWAAVSGIVAACCVLLAV
jgi:hypothetical protein